MRTNGDTGFQYIVLGENTTVISHVYYPLEQGSHIGLATQEPHTANDKTLKP